MPLFLLNILGWVKTNPVQAIQATVVACLVGLAIWLYFDYTGTKRENVALTARVEQAEANYASAKSRIDEFVVAQEKFEADLEQLRQSSIAIRGEVRKALKGFKASEIEREYRDNPVEAESALNKRFDDLRRMFEHVTGGAPEPH